MKKNKNYKLLFIISIFLIITILFNNNFKDSLNNFLKIIYLNDNKNIIFSDELTKNYINTLEEELSKYKEITKLNNCIKASLIYRNPSIWYDEFIINKGSNDNIKINDIVINNEGLIGKVKNVYKNSSLISIITNTSNKERITVGITNDKEIVYGIISDYDKLNNEIIISEVTKDIENNENLSVVTTSFTNTYKDGIIIGKVKNIIDDSNGLSKKVIATPKVDYNNIKYVCVINNK